MSRSVVVILSTADDVHTRAVAREIQDRHPALRTCVFDGSDFPTKATLAIRPDGWTLSHEGGTLTSGEVRSVWNRRPKGPSIDPAVKDEATRRFASAEAGHTLDFIAMSREYPVINRMEAQYLANRKPYQLAIARDCGFLIPDYAITNDPKVVEALIHGSDAESYIFKTLSAPLHTFGETRRLDASHLPMIDTVRIAPAIFQRLVERGRELRVTVIGDQMFANEMVVHNEVAKGLPDWRVDSSVLATPAEIPRQTQAAIQKLMKKLGLVYGAVDLIEDPQGRMYFLEVNPAGQFLFAEIDAGAPLSAAFADLLAQ